MNDKNTVRSVERALDILLCFTTQPSLSMSEIAQHVGLHKSTVHRLLASLEGKGFVVRDTATEKYKLGFRIWELSVNVSQSDDPAILFLAEMEQLRDRLGETVSLYVRDGNERIRIQAVQSNHSVRRVAPIGVRLPLYVGASSKILVAYEKPRQQMEIIQQLPEMIDKTTMLEQMTIIRAQGYATSSEERESGVAAIAAPVFDRQGHFIAALSVSGPINRMSTEKIQEHIDPIMEAARRMGRMK